VFQSLPKAGVSLGAFAARLLNLTIKVLEVLEARPQFTVQEACDFLGLNAGDGDDGRYVRTILCRLDLVGPPGGVGFEEEFASLIMARFSATELPTILASLNGTALARYQRGMQDITDRVAAFESAITTQGEVSHGA